MSMEVYLAYWCNNELYEDYHEYVDAVFSTHEKAVAYIESEGFKPHVCKDEFERRHMANRFDSKPDEYGDYDSMWVRAMGVDDVRR